MRVACVAGYSDVVGGGQVSLLQLLRCMDRARFSPFLVCAAEGEVARRARALDVEVALLGCGPLDSVAAVRHAVGLRRVARTFSAQVLHCDTVYTALAGGVAVLGTGIPLVFHARTAESGGALDRVVPPLCAAVICVSGAAAARFTHRPPATIRVVHNGVDLSEFRPRDGDSVRAGLGITPDTFVIGYCGQLIRAKGLAHLLDAVAMLRADGGRCALLLQGRGVDEDVLLKGEAPNVRLLPFADSTADFYTALDVFVLPTLLREGLSRTLIEAMASGLPCVTTPLGGNPEAVVDGETGVLVPAGDAGALYRALRDLRQHADRRHGMARAARARAERIFDLSESIRRVERVYGEVAA